MDNDWEQYELEATLREMLENGDESPASGARREASPQGAVLARIIGSGALFRSQMINAWRGISTHFFCTLKHLDYIHIANI